MRVERTEKGWTFRVPDDVAAALGLRDGEEVEVHAVGDGRVAASAEVQRRRAIIDRIRSVAVPLPADYKFDREEADRR